jgi:hypothetical protein
LLLAGLAVRITDGYAAAASLLKRALRALHDEGGRATADVRWPGFARAVALDMFDDETCHAICTRSVELAREPGALGVLPLALNYLAALHSFEGELDAAESLIEEADTIAGATRATRVRWSKLTLAGSAATSLRCLSSWLPARQRLSPEARMCCSPSASMPPRFSATASATTRLRYRRRRAPARWTC